MGVERSDISVSEKKRLESLRQKKEAFRAKGQAVQNALKNLDCKPKKTKFTFDDNDETPAPKVKRKKKGDLFDEDDNDDGEAQPNWEKDDFQIKTTSGKILNKYAFGNDERFKLDERFIDDHKSEEKTENNGEKQDESDLQKEKEWQLDLLGSVLGVPVVSKNKESNSGSRKNMIRYDPSEKAHSTFEIVQEKPEPNTKKAKKKRKKEKSINETTETETKPIEVSKDIFYSVSEDLTKSFKEPAGYSLLQKFGKEESNQKSDHENGIPANSQNQTQKFKISFDAKNPFKYDSSDAENEDRDNDHTLEHISAIKEKSSLAAVEQFFFQHDDVRFNEAVKFFSKDYVPPGDFKTLRRELKQIVRSKIRKNVRKTQPWGGKRNIRNRSNQKT